MGACAGVAWAKDDHAIVVDERADLLVEQPVAYDEQGVTALCRLLVRLEAERVPVERPGFVGRRRQRAGAGRAWSQGRRRRARVPHRIDIADGVRRGRGVIREPLFIRPLQATGSSVRRAEERARVLQLGRRRPADPNTARGASRRPLASPPMSRPSVSDAAKLARRHRSGVPVADGRGRARRQLAPLVDNCAGGVSANQAFDADSALAPCRSSVTR